MAKAIANLRIQLTAVTGAFSKGMADSEKKLQRFGKQARQSNSDLGVLSKGFSRLGGVVAAAFSVNAIRNSIAQSLDAVDALSKTADKLGIGIEQLQAFHFAAGQSGIRVETFNMALQRMTRRLNEAAIGTGEAQGALKELGLDARHLSLLRPDVQFLEIAKALEGVNNQGTRVRLLFKFFDSEGVALANMTNRGADGLREMMKEAERLGLILSPEAAERAVEAKDSIDAMRKSLAGLRNEIVSDAAPAITSLSNSMAGAVSMQKPKGLLDFLVGFSLFPLVSTVKSLNKETRGSASALPWFEGLARSLGEAKLKLDEMNETQRAAAAEKSLERSLEEQKRLIEEATTAEQRYTQQVQTAQKFLAFKGITVDQFNRLMTKYKEELDNATGATAKLKEEQQELEGILESIKTPLDLYQEKLLRLNQLFDKGAISQNQFALAAENLHSALISQSGIPGLGTNPLREFELNKHKINELLRAGEIDSLQSQVALEASRQSALGGLGINLDEIKTPLQRFSEDLFVFRQAFHNGLLTQDELNALTELSRQKFGITDQDERQQNAERRDPGEFRQGKISLAGITSGPRIGAPTSRDPQVAAIIGVQQRLDAMLTTLRGGLQVAV